MPLLESLLAFVAPHECLNCGTEGSLLCLPCSTDVLETIPDRCYRCLRVSTDSAVCRTCRRDVAIRYVWVATEYDGIAKQLVKAYKFERALAAHKPIAEHILSSLPYVMPTTVIVHLPTATSRQRLRGYDQSQLLARYIGKQLGRTYSPLLERTGQFRQVGSTRKQRRAQMQGALYVPRPELVKGKHVLLIDDIVTTGASIEAAAHVLKKAGAKQVDAAVFAQKH